MKEHDYVELIDTVIRCQETFPGGLRGTIVAVHVPTVVTVELPEGYSEPSRCAVFKTTELKVVEND